MTRRDLPRAIVFTAAALFAATSLGCRPAAPPVVQTGLEQLRQSIAVPSGATDAKWLIVRQDSGGLLPGPGTSVLLARLQFDREALHQLRAAGGWSSPERLPAILDVLGDPDDETGAVLRCIPPNPANTVISGTTWMEAEMFVDERRSAVFLVLKKS